MTCKHHIIQTWRFEDGDPAMWACFDCKHKFVPIEQMMSEIAAEREECAKVCDSLRPSEREFDSRYWDAAEDCATAIRNRT